MLNVNNLHDYQKRAANHVLEHAMCMLWLSTGLGKTPVTLTAFTQLQNYGAVRAALVLGPLRVVQSVWEREARKWEHTKHLKFSLITGTPEQRRRALTRPADIYLINYENLAWLTSELKHLYINRGTLLPFDMLVADEVSKLKNPETRRVESLISPENAQYPVLPYFTYRVGLTGTPSSNGLEDLFGQFLVIDNGQRLGTSRSNYINNYFEKADNNGYKHKVTAQGEKIIHRLVSDITLDMKAEDYLDMPDLIINDVYVDLAPKHREQYEELERLLFTELDNGAELEVVNEAAKSNKCIAEDTKVLTSKGWLNIQDCTTDLLIWDGVEWVNFDGLAIQGEQDVILFDGVWMTKDHKVLTVSGWHTAEEINKHGESSKRYNRTEVRIPHSNSSSRIKESKKFKYSKSNLVSKVRLWNRIRSYWDKFKKESTSSEIMWLQTFRSSSKGEMWSWDDSYSTLGNLVKHALQMQQPERQRLSELWGSWDKRLQTMGIFQLILGGYGGHLFRQCDHRTVGQHGKLYASELQMAFAYPTGEQQKNQSVYKHTYWSNNPSASSKTLRINTGFNIPKDETGLGRKGFTVTTKRKKTFDLINCGPRNRFVALGDKPIIVHNCLQFSNGAAIVNTETRQWEPVHDAKLNALEDLIEEAGGQPMLLAYNYRADAERIMKKFPYAKNITGMSGDEFNQALVEWQRGDLRLLIGHPASMAHGIDGLQDNGHIMVWYGLNWSLELYLQFTARLHRQGQGVPVISHRILTRDTLDDAVRIALETKTQTQESLREAVAAYRNRKTKGTT